MRVLLPEALMTEIRQHGRESYPDECCGVMIGLPQSADGVTEVRQLVAAENTREASARSRRFLIEPRLILSTSRRARALGLDIVGYYHSHPDHPAIPSDFDREHAWPATSYLIVSVREGLDAEMRSWRLVEDRSSYQEEAVHRVEAMVTDHDPSSAEIEKTEKTEETEETPA